MAIRLHDGQADVINGTFDSKTSEFSFESDKFFTYTIVYKDVPIENSNGGSNKPDNGGSDKPDNGVSDKPEDGSKESAPNGEEQKDTPEVEVVDVLPMEEEQLSHAVNEIQKKLPNVQPGPYVQIPQGQDDAGNETQQFAVEIPEELLKEGRTYYLVSVDDDGNIVILQNDDLKDGVLKFTGNPNSIYQIVYEDGTAYLADMMNESGYLVGENGDVITINTNHCFWHYIICVLALIGITLSLFFKEKRKNQLLTVGIVTILMIILIIAGWCIWDVLLAILAEVIMVAFIIWPQNKQEEDGMLV